jgi:NAD(P)-dependent dehydrogenase (short-subunit alcohol dehydrogenase family)
VTLFGLPSSSIMVNVARGNMESGMLEGQTAVVIAGTSGIGLAAAIELCRAGTQVWLIGRTPDNATAAASRMGDRASGHAVDARDAMKLQAFFTRVGEFDHLIVALGGGSAIGPFKDLNEAQMRAGFDNKFWPYLNVIRNGVGPYSRFWIDNFSHRRCRAACHQGHLWTRGGERSPASDRRALSAGIRADPRQRGFARPDCHALLGSYARGCSARDVSALSRECSGRTRRGTE